MEPDKSVEPIMANRALQFDAAAEVPDEYDLLCEGCGYSLVGISSEICPECGKAFEPHQLLIARVPWLHRRKIGPVKAYLKTFWMVIARPRQFATELCRPVRISITDARAFRQTSIRIATAGLAIISLVSFAIFAWDTLGRNRWMGLSNRWTLIEIAEFGASALTVLLGCHVCFCAMTDLPVFIWKGHPSLKPAELAPIRCYAAAPVAMIGVTPLLVLGLMGSVRLGLLHLLPNRLVVLAIWFGVPLVIWLILLLNTTFRLMIGAGVERSRAWMMAAYMPLHWIMMAFACGAIAGLLIWGESWIFGELRHR